MGSTMKDFWFMIPDGCDCKTESTPLDWLPFSPQSILNDTYLIRSPQNTPKELREIAATYKSGFPVIQDTEFDILFLPEGVAGFLGEGEQFNNGDFTMLVAEHCATHQIVSSIILRFWKKQRNVEFVAIATHADYQQSGIGRHMVECADQYIDACSVEMAFVWAAVEHTVSQRILLDCGFTFRAVVPGFYRIWTGKTAAYRRTTQVFGQKFYHGAETMRAKAIHLLPEIVEMLQQPLAEYTVQNDEPAQ